MKVHFSFAIYCIIFGLLYSLNNNDNKTVSETLYGRHIFTIIIIPALRVLKDTQVSHRRLVGIVVAGIVAQIH